jgi:hypothetical protein
MMGERNSSPIGEPLLLYHYPLKGGVNICLLTKIAKENGM